MSAFVRQIGYSGFLTLLDEGVNLYKISNSITRSNNYEKLLTMFNDTMQGKSEGLGIYLCGTPQFVEDTRRGLFSYEALRTRLVSTRFVKDGVRDMQSPLIYLEKLTNEEIFVLLQKVINIHEQHYGYKSSITEDNIVSFMKAEAKRVGADELLTPREIIRDFIGILNIMQQKPETSFEDMLGEDYLNSGSSGQTNTNDEDDGAAVFSL